MKRYFLQLFQQQLSCHRGVLISLLYILYTADIAMTENTVVGTFDDATVIIVKDSAHEKPTEKL